MLIIGEEITNTIHILPIAIPENNDEQIRLLHYGVPGFFMQGTIYHSNNTAKCYDIYRDMIEFLEGQKQFLKDGETISYVECFKNEEGEVKIPKIKGLTKYQYMNNKW